MNPRLRSLLAEVTGSAEWGEPDAWSRVLLLHSIGRIPPSRAEPGDRVWNRGFDMILLDPRGAPAYFCKCRPAADVTLRRTTAIREVLCRDPALGTVIPQTRGGCDNCIRIETSVYVRGERYDRMVSRLGRAAWEVSLRGILDTAELLATRATAVLPELLVDPGPVSLAAASSPHLSCLERAGVLGHHLETLRAALTAAGTVPRRLQHGDLWTKNVIRAEGSWWLVDFELFGEIQVPLYDTFQLIRTCCELRSQARPGGSYTWLDQMARGDMTALVCRRAVSEASARHSLSAEQTNGAVVYYIVDVAARIYARGAPRALWAPYVAEVERVARALQMGQRLESVFLAS